MFNLGVKILHTHSEIVNSNNSNAVTTNLQLVITTVISVLQLEDRSKALRAYKLEIACNSRIVF